MANSSQAKKRARQNNTRRLHNTSLRSKIRTSRKKFQAAIAEGNVELATSAYKDYAAILDKHAGTNIIHKNTAARYKSRQSVVLKKLVANNSAPAKKKAKK